MRSRTATPQGDRSEIEAAALTDHAHVQQIRAWVAAHRLDACRGCTEFRLDELGLAQLIASLDCDRSRRQVWADESGSSFARR